MPKKHEMKENEICMNIEYFANGKHELIYGASKRCGVDIHSVTRGVWVKIRRPMLYRIWCVVNLTRKKGLGSGYQQKDRKPSQNDKTEHGMEKTVQNQGQSPKMPKSESILKNTIGCNLYPSDGPGKPNSIFMKTVKTKWALNQLQQPICVQLTKTVKTLKAQS
ncbi:hypothetical protein Tco_0298975 [Tanacetum coccineum]